jgi:hypothetical protein
MWLRGAEGAVKAVRVRSYRDDCLAYAEIGKQPGARCA